MDIDLSRLSHAAQRIEMKEMPDRPKAVRAREEIGTVVAQLCLIDGEKERQRERERETDMSTPRGNRCSNAMFAGCKLFALPPIGGTACCR